VTIHIKFQTAICCLVEGAVATSRPVLAASRNIEPNFLTFLVVYNLCQSYPSLSLYVSLCFSLLVNHYFRFPSINRPFFTWQKYCT